MSLVVVTPPPPRRRRRWGRRLAIGFGGLCLMLALLVGAGVWLDARYPLVLDRYLDRSTVVLDADGAVLRAYTTKDGTWRLPATVEDVSPLYLSMLLAYEDHRYYDHHGVDPLALVRAIGQLATSGRVVSGASTLTMQTVRLLEPRPRTLWSKIIEIGRAIQLEAHYGKDEILAMYLTLAPFGGNLEGVRAASLAYFGKEPRALTAGEAALLVALPQSPTRLRPDRFPEVARAARDRVLVRVAGEGAIDPGAAAEAMETPTPVARATMPFMAPHLSDWLVARAPGAPTVESFIDRRLQAGLEDLATRALRDLDPMANVAIVAVDNRTLGVVGYVGSAAFFDQRRDGAVDLARAVRSPGSTLKPFVYGMGFEDRIIVPETLIRDAPTRFGDYAPTNFEPGYAGDVTVRDALENSLNVPAVALLDRVGPVRFAARLAAAGTPIRLPPGSGLPGLPIILGGGGMTLVDLATLYTALANGGEEAALRWSPADPMPADRMRLLDPLATWYLADILAGAPSPVAMMDAEAARAPRRIAFKTGTSYGFRDAWAIGWDADHTIAVWVGRPDGSPSPDRYGRATAAPLLWRAFGLLPAPAADVVGPAPADAVLAATTELPARLRRLASSGVLLPPPANAVPPDPLVIAVPADGARVATASDDTLTLVARGGQRPLRWLVDGRPVASSPLARDVRWTPPGPGQTRITVIDATGATASAQFWVN
jgi:penicillin-binding protein 1C